MTTYKTPPSVLERLSQVEEAAKKSSIIFDYDPDDVPGAPSGFTHEFKIKEKKTDLWFKSIVTVDALAQGACAGDIEMYECQMRAVDENNIVIEDFKRVNEFFFINDEEAIPDTIRFEFGYLEQPKRWKWQFRVRAIAKQNRGVGEWGPGPDSRGWSQSYGPPWYNATPEPPAPADLYLTVFKNPDDKNEPRWAVKCEAEEVGPWDIPPVDPGKEKAQREDDVAEYEFLLRFCDSTGNFLTYVDDRLKTRYRERKKMIPAKDQDDNDFIRATFFNLKRRCYFKVKCRSIDRFKRRGPWSGWSALASPLFVNENVPLVKHPITGVPGDYITDLDQHILHLRYEFEIDPDDTDNDLKDPDKEVVGVQIQVSDRADFNQSLSNVWEHDRFHSGQKWKVRIKKPSGTLHTRVRCVNASGTKGNWATESVNTKIPPVPDSLVAVTIGKMKKNKNNKWYAQGEFEYNEAGYNEDHIGTWVLLLQANSVQAGHTAANGWGLDPEDRKTFGEKDKRSNGKFRHRFKKLVAKEWVSMAFFVKDKQGRTSPISDWSAPIRLSTAQPPAKPTNVSRITKHRKVGIKGRKPMDPDDSTISDTNIIEYRIQRANDAAFTNIIDDEYSETPKKTYDLAKGDKTQYFLRIASVDEEGNQSNWVYDNGTEGPPTSGAVAEDIDLTQDVTGSLPYANMGSLGVSRWGPYASMVAAAAKQGDIWIATTKPDGSAQSPPRVYQYDGSSWSDATVAQTILAQAIVAGAIDGHTINGVEINAGSFYSQTPDGTRWTLIEGGVVAFGFWADAGNSVIEAQPKGIKITLPSGEGGTPQLNIVGGGIDSGGNIDVSGFDVNNVGALRVTNIYAHNATRPSFQNGLGIPAGQYIRINDTVTGAGAKTAEDRWVSVETPAGVRWLRCFV